MNKHILALLTLFILFSYPAKAKNNIVIRAVSYTHLTLPTN